MKLQTNCQKRLQITEVINNIGIALLDYNAVASFKLIKLSIPVIYRSIIQKKRTIITTKNIVKL